MVFHYRQFCHVDVISELTQSQGTSQGSQWTHSYIDRKKIEYGADTLFENAGTDT